jgi:hypothetical protein
MLKGHISQSPASYFHLPAMQHSCQSLYSIKFLTVIHFRQYEKDLICSLLVILMSEIGHPDRI